MFIFQILMFVSLNFFSVFMLVLSLKKVAFH